MVEKRIVFRRTLGEQDDFDPTPMVWIREFNFESATLFAKQIADYEADYSVKEIFMYISSYGGELIPLLAMIDAMLECTKPIHSIVLGSGASCGAVLAIAAPGKRFIGEMSSLHVHHVRTMIGEDLPGIEQEIKTLNKIESKLIKVMAKRSGRTMAEIKGKLKEENREWHVSSQEALDWGFVDIIGIPKISSSLVVECEY